MAKNAFSKVQREQYDKLPEEVKKDVDDGYGVVVCDLESEATICKFKMENYLPTDEQSHTWDKCTIYHLDDGGVND